LSADICPERVDAMDGFPAWADLCNCDCEEACPNGRGTICNDISPAYVARICTCSCESDTCKPVASWIFPITSLVTSKLKYNAIIIKKIYILVFFMAKVIVAEILVTGWIWWITFYGTRYACDVGLVQLASNSTLLNLSQYICNK